MHWFVKAYHNVLSQEICQEIISKFENDPRKNAGITQGGYNPDLKTSTDLPISPYDDWRNLDLKVYEAMGKTFDVYREAVPGMQHLHCPLGDTGYQVQRYLPNGVDGFKWHIDCGSRESADRMLAAILYLNDVEEGGETEFEFPDGNISIKPKAGTIIWFPPNYLCPHRGKTPISGPKYIITTFMVYGDAGTYQHEANPS